MLFDKPTTPKITEITEVRKFEVFKKNDYKNSMQIGKNLKQLEKAFANISDGDCIQFMTNGAWSSHDMIDFFIRKVGKCNVYLTSWAVSEQAARKIDKLYDQGYIRELTCLFDYRIKDRKSDPIALLERFGSVHLGKIHAKVIVLQNEKIAITIITSGNLSKNLRIEAGTIFCCQASANFHKQWIKEESELVLLEEAPLKKYLQKTN